MLVRLLLVSAVSLGLLTACLPVEGPGGPGVPGPGCGKTRVGDAFEYPVLLDVGELTRRYALRVPENYDKNRPYPVVLIFHGDADCEEFDDVDDVCLRPQAAAPGTRDAFGLEPLIGDDAVLVYVEGHNLNAFEPRLLSWDTFRPAGANPDFAFVDAILAELDDELCVDAARTFAVGFSGGGFFADSLACLHGGLTGVATFEGGFEAGELEISFDADNVVDLAGCAPDAPAALVIHAADDNVVPPRYGSDAAEHFRTANGCAAETVPSDLDDDCEAFVGCRAGGDTVLCTPASADPPRTHAVWQPEGSLVLSSFLQSQF
ncbi:MAG: hypothetical protein Q8O67_21390 [Deltaproteobacteria bacterium]|nr:hypothetical protein [Deltaproteobacteria bacterium]